MVRIKRAYEEPARSDGFRVLVDRLWPRGVKKEDLRLDLWAKGLAPSPALRRWFGHEPARFREFAKRYQAELRAGTAPTLLSDLAHRAERPPGSQLVQHVERLHRDREADPGFEVGGQEIAMARLAPDHAVVAAVEEAHELDVALGASPGDLAAALLCVPSLRPGPISGGHR